MEALDLYQLEERHNTASIMPDAQQYQYHNQQNQSSLPTNQINNQYLQQYFVETIVCQEPSRLAQASCFQQRIEQKTVSIEQYRGMQLENQRLRFLNEQLNNQIEQLKRGSKKSSQFTLDEEKKKQFDVQDINPTTPQRRKSKKLVKQSEDMTVQSNNQLSDQKDYLHKKQLDEYKIMLKNEEKKVLEYEQKLKKSQKKNKKISQQFKKSEQSRKKLQKKKQNLEYQCKQVQNQNDKAHQMLKYQRNTVTSFQEKIINYYQEIETYKQQISIQKTKIISLQEQFKILNNKNQKLSKDLQNLRVQYQEKIASKDKIIQTRIRQNETTKKFLQNTITQKENQITQIQSLNNKLQSQKKTHETKIQNLQATVEKLKQESRKLQSTNAELERKLKQERAQKVTLVRNISSLDQQLKDEKEANLKFKKEKEAEKKQLQTQISGLKNKLKKNQQIFAQKQKQYFKQIRERDEQIKRKISQNQELINFVKKYRSILKPLCEYSNLPFDEDNIDYGIGQNLMNQILKGKYFQESVILNQADPRKRQFLFKQLTSFLSIPTFKSKLLFKYDPIIPNNNFFNYILDIKNLMILVKLINGTIIGGFTVSPYGKEIQRPGRGFIFSLTLEKSFKMKNQPKVPVLQNDTYFLIMGNSELRIKYCQKKFFTNFGVAAATFDNNGFTKQQFLGVKEPLSELDFQTYQIYAINNLQ